MNVQWDREVDVVVAGSGAAALTAAITAAEGGRSVELFEKAHLLGGTTAVSGGGVWVPRNPHMREMGLDDSREEAIAYALSTTKGRAPDPALVELYVDKVLEATEFLETKTPVKFFVAKVFSDYFADRPGGRKVGRTLDNEPYAAPEALGEWNDRLRHSQHYVPTTLDERSTGGPSGIDRGGGASAVALSGELLELAAERAKAGIRTCGEALAARLLRGALDYGVVPHTDSPVTGLVLDDDHRVVGARVRQEGRELAIRAHSGVVLATGGFEWNPDLVRAYLGISELRPASPPANTGDGLIMALEAGALVANMTEAWWFPVTSTERLTFEGHLLHSGSTPRSQAGCITVNSSGRRFTNEAACYMDIGRVFRTFDPVTGTFPNEVAWSIFDARARAVIELADFKPGLPTPDWVKEAPTVEALAEEIGVDPKTLAAEVERFNGFVADGEDRDFGRGTLWYEGMTTGGPSKERALGSISEPPFFAMRLYNGALGTCGGPRIDAHGRVLAAGGGVIEGLYAAGNASASVFGPGYPAGGATIGPALTFGYLAGRHLATERAPRLDATS